MTNTSGDANATANRGRQVRRWAPVAVIIVVVVAIVAVLVSSGGGNGGGDNAEQSTPQTGGASGGRPVPGRDAVSFSTAEELGIVDEIDWGRRCDTERGTVAIPYFFAAECYAPFTGDNGGATAKGVTEDTLRIVYFLDKDDDPIINYVTGPLDYDDTNEDEIATMENFLSFYETYYETYGRSVELIVYQNTSGSADVVQARAQAAQIAEEIQPFMVFGGPLLAGEQFGEELAARGVAWLSLGGVPSSLATENAPYIFGIGKGAVHSRIQLAEYIGKRLAGENAVHSPDYSRKPRKFAYLYIETSELSNQTADRFEQELRDKYDVDLADVIPYTLDPATIQEQTATIIGRLKDRDITSVIMSSDAIAPGNFTREATAQDYFPEWIISSVALVDTNVFGRTYDQKQWANAFGLSEGAANYAREIAGPYFLHDWFFGEPPPADEQVPLIQPWPGVLYSVLQAVGPELTHQRFYDTLFAGDPTARGGITQVSLSWGNKGLWPKDLEPDPNGVDDLTEVWWNPDERGVDENGDEGRGMYMYVDGGKRYLPGQLPKTPSRVFDPKGAVSFYTELPESERAPDYEPLPPVR
jgi:hypothetical protein